MACSARRVARLPLAAPSPLHRALQKRRYLSIKTFLMWVWTAVYQGAVIMLGGIVLFEERFVHVVRTTSHHLHR